MDKKLVVAGVTGGGILAFLITVFSFISAAPWATKQELQNAREKIQQVEETHAKDMARLETKQEQMATKQDVTLLLEMMKEIKADVKDMKRNGK